VEALRERRTERVDGELVDGKALLRAAVLELLADLPAMGQRVGVGVEPVAESGVFKSDR
jgi:hypothetical protein